MRTLGNILWHFPFFGFVDALAMFVYGTLLTILVIPAPIGLGLIQYSKFLLLPFSYAMVSKNDLQLAQNKYWKTYSVVIMIFYLPFGCIFAFVAALQVVGLCLTIVGIPAALVIAKSIGTLFNPVGKVCVPVAVAQSIESEKSQKFVEQYHKQAGSGKGV